MKFIELTSANKNGYGKNFFMNAAKIIMMMRFPEDEANVERTEIITDQDTAIKVQETPEQILAKI